MDRDEETELRATENMGLDIALSDIADSVEDELLVIDREYRLRFANSAVYRKLQGNVGNLLGRPCYEILHNRKKPCAAPLWNCPLRKTIESGNVTTLIHAVPTQPALTYTKVTA